MYLGLKSISHIAATCIAAVGLLAITNCSSEKSELKKAHETRNINATGGGYVAQRGDTQTWQEQGFDRNSAKFDEATGVWIDKNNRIYAEVCVAGHTIPGAEVNDRDPKGPEGSFRTWSKSENGAKCIFINDDGTEFMAQDRTGLE